MYKDVTRNNDPPIDKDTDSIGNRNTTDAVTSVSRNKSNNMGHNRPTASSNVGEKNIGSRNVVGYDL